MQAYVVLLTKCNLRCSHCIRSFTKNTDDIIGIEDANNIFEEIYKNNPNTHLIITGGEPTLSLDLKNILNYLIDLECKIVIYTNGRLINDYNRYFDLPNIYWIIPFYGLKDIHDKYTGDIGSFTETFSNLEQLRNKKKGNIKINFTSSYFIVII